MSSPEAISLMLVDDHFVVRSGLASSLELEDDLRIVAEADRGEDALEIYREKRPDVVIMDLQLPGISGIEATREICQEEDGAKVLMFTTFARDDEILAAIEAGASGYLQKSSTREELVAAIRSLHAGETCFAAEISERLEGLQSGPSITLREREILRLIAQGQANKEIAAQLGIAEDTVKRHASNIFQKFSVSDRAEATAEAIRRGIVKVDD